MKFESKFGIGEIVIRGLYKNGEFIGDNAYEVMSASFEKDATHYACRATDGRIVAFNESELEGDPEFDQELGKYPISPDL